MTRWEYNARAQVVKQKTFSNVPAATAASPTLLVSLTTRVPDSRTLYSYASSLSADYPAYDLMQVSQEWPSQTPPPAAQITRLTRYDKNGRVLAFTSPDGSTTQLTYHARGWLTQYRYLPFNGNLQTTSYSYDAAGQLKKATLPDNSAVSFTYDAARRLTSVADSAGNKVIYTLDAKGDIASQQQIGNRQQLATREVSVYYSLYLPDGITALATIPVTNPDILYKSVVSPTTATTNTFKNAATVAQSAAKVQDELPDYTPCNTYDQSKKASKCAYDRMAASVCRGDTKGFWSPMANFALNTCTAFYATPNKTANCIRRCLAQEHQAAQNKPSCFKGRGCKDLPCVSRTCIHSYHAKCFDQCGVTPFCYGGIYIPLIPWGRENDQ